MVEAIRPKAGLTLILMSKDRPMEEHLLRVINLINHQDQLPTKYLSKKDPT